MYTLKKIFILIVFAVLLLIPTVFCAAQKSRNEISVKYPESIVHNNREITFLYSKIVGYLKVSSYEKVVSLSDELLKIDSDQKETHRIRSFAIIKVKTSGIKDFEKSISDSDFLLKNNPDKNALNLKAFALAKLADLLAQRGNLDAAQKKCSAALSIYPDSITLLVKRAGFYRKLGKEEKAEADWQIILKNQELSKNIKRRGHLFFNNYGQKLYKQKAYKKAIEKYNIAVSLAPQNAILLVNRGIAFIALKKYTEAEKNISSALTYSSDMPLGLYGMGLVMYYRGEFPQAYHFFSNLLRISPKFKGIDKDLNAVFSKLDTGFRLGLEYFRSGNYQKALDSIRPLIGKDDPVLIYFAAASMFEMGMLKDALSLLTSKIPDHGLYPENSFLLGKIYFMEGDYSNAKHYFSLISESKVFTEKQKKELMGLEEKLPVLTSETFRKGRAFFLKKDYKKALKVFLAPDKPEISETYAYAGKCFLNLGIFPKAVISFQKAIKLEPDRSDYRFALARVLYFEGNFYVAKVMLNDILSFSPYHVPSKKLLSSIEIHDNVDTFLSGYGGNWNLALEKQFSVGGETPKKICKKVAVFASEFFVFLENKFPLPEIPPKSAHFYIKVFKTKKSFQKLKDIIGKDAAYENFIFYHNPISDKSFVAGYWEEKDKRGILKDLSFEKLFFRNLRHALFHQYLRSKIIKPPSWIDEGLACYMETAEEKPGGSCCILKPNWNRMTALRMMFLAKDYYLLDLKKLFSLKREDFLSNPQVYYQESYGVCRYSFSNCSGTFISRLLNRLQKYASEEENLAAAFPVEIASIEQFQDCSVSMENETFERYVKNELFDPTLEKGLIFYQQGEWSDAISEFSASLASNPGLTENLLYMGLAFFKKNEFDISLNYLKEYMALEADRTSPWVFIAAISKINGQMKDFRQAFRKAEKFEPKNPLVLALRKEKNIWQEKRKKYKTVQQGNTVSKSEKSLRSITSIKQLDYYSLEGRENGDAREANNTGVYYFNSRFYQKAAKKFIDALSIKKDFFMAQYNLGLSYFFIKENSYAVENFLKALEIAEKKPSESDIYFYLSRTYSRMKKKKEAKNYLMKYEEAKKLNTSNNP